RLNPTRQGQKRDYVKAQAEVMADVYHNTCTRSRTGQLLPEGRWESHELHIDLPTNDERNKTWSHVMAWLLTAHQLKVKDKLYLYGQSFVT
ncbi:hypothetical protein ABTA52_18915, partial [Acinetobacter baumannii]